MDKANRINNSNTIYGICSNITILFSYSNESINFSDIPVKITDNNINLNDLFEEILKRLPNLSKTAISYYDICLESYIFCGILPFTGNVTVPVNDNMSKGNINLKFRSRQIIVKDNLMRMELNEENPEQEENNQNIFINSKSKRSKERKIGFIIEKVYLWRKLYNGFFDDKSNFIKLTLEEAADKVGISKKSLDDYLIQLR